MPEEAYEPPSTSSDSSSDTDPADARATLRARRWQSFDEICVTSSDDDSDEESTPLSRLTWAGAHLDHDDITALDSITTDDSHDTATSTTQAEAPLRLRRPGLRLSGRPHHLLPQPPRL